MEGICVFETSPYLHGALLFPLGEAGAQLAFSSPMTTLGPRGDVRNLRTDEMRGIHKS